ncbi:unnamed protein product [Cuscuta campestris]|uniref:Uncharacterized protein n=1 Tax=Cuscuta campestris TaxID=132261 RepID=A0A484LR33_9ASTE|nr:unnamed protein product [Cuscuta campestris]
MPTLSLPQPHKALASESLPSSHGNDMCGLQSLSFSRASAGYSLLRACSAHHLLLFEPSLIDLNVEFQEIINLTPNVWHILAEGGFLKLVKDPIDFKWIGSTELSVLAPPIHVADSSEMKSNAETEGAGLQALTM